MCLNDEEYFLAVKSVFDLLPNLFVSEAAFTITDKEKYVLVKQANSFEVNVWEGKSLDPNSAAMKTIKTKEKHMKRYSKEEFGHPVMAYSVPIINSYSENVLGTISYTVSLEKESEVIEMANELRNFSEDLAASSEELASSTEELSANTQSVSSLITNTEIGINGMNDILGYVKSIADTTNLLGLNAAIEAARAGEHGRGFAVVSGEIRKLATNSKQSVSQINEKLKAVRKDVNNIISFIKDFTVTSENQASQAEHIAHGSERLSQLSSKLQQLAENINQ